MSRFLPVTTLPPELAHLTSKPELEVFGEGLRGTSLCGRDVYDQAAANGWLRMRAEAGYRRSFEPETVTVANLRRCRFCEDAQRILIG